MSIIYGFDLGTNSIGWAVINKAQNEIIGMGARIFPEGVNEIGREQEISKNASRREARSIRRMHFRKKLRKKYLLKILAEHNLCPLAPEDVKHLTPQTYTDKKMTEWFKLNPYQLRAKAVDEKIELQELGRIFYHMIQRRGFLSNSRTASTDDKEEGKLYEGNIKEGKTGILETYKEIKSDTLGKALYKLYPPEKHPYRLQEKRIRNRYTTREMYVNEFEAIWEKQRQFHPELNNELKTIIGGRKKDGYSMDGAIFFQRPLKTQKYLVGNCTFEPKKTRCPKSAIPFELFRVYQWVNTVECNGYKLTKEEREKVVHLLLTKEKVTFKAIRKAINKLDSYYQFNYKDDDKIVGTYTISKLVHKNLFGAEWFSLSEKEQEDIWHVLYFFDDKDKLKEYAKKKWGLNEEAAERISKLRLVKGYSNLSRKAINNILPFLKKGYSYDIAVTLGGIRNAFGDKWTELKEEDIKLIEDNIEGIVRSKTQGGYIDIVRRFLTDEFGITEKELKKLYHHSADITKQKVLDKLPTDKEADKEIQSIRNPVVMTALFELRKVVNELIERFGKPDEIKVELARELKLSRKDRIALRKKQKRLENENDRVKNELRNIGQDITHENILKYKLWEECNQTCPYTGRSISLQQLFSGEVQIEHIQPWSKSLNDSYMNKTLCFADENRAKGDRTPYEYYFLQKGEKKWEQVKEQALSCFKNKHHYPNAYLKFKQFIKQSYDEDFISRQLNDTRYISREAKNYLSKVCSKVQVAQGQLTANLRQKWGLNSVLGDEDTKARDDHRHHAIDALIIACSTAGYLQELSKWNRYRRNPQLKNFPLPWDGFFEDTKKAVNRILVSHKKTDRLITVRTTITKKDGKLYKNKGIAARGQLHKESIYGKRKPPEKETPAFHIRKPLETLTTRKQIEKIVDPAIRRIIFERVENLGGFTNDGKIPANAFFEIDDKGQPQPQIFLPNKNGDPVPVKRVRTAENLSGAEQLKNEINQFVNPRSNHHVLVYKTKSGNLKEEVVTFWSAVQRRIKGLPVFQIPEDGATTITTMQINDMFILGLNETDINWDAPDFELINTHLYRIQKLSSKSYEFRLHSESQIDKNYVPFYIRIQSFGTGKTGWLTYNPIKVKLTPTGQLFKTY